MRDFLTLDIECARLREMTVWEATLLSQFSKEDMTKGMEYFLNVLPSLVVDGNVDFDVLNSKPMVALELYNSYTMWLFNPLTEEDIHKLSQDCRGTFEGRSKHTISPYHDWITNLFLPLLDGSNGILIREVFQGSRAEQPYRSDLILRIIASIYGEWASRKRRESLRKK